MLLLKDKCVSAPQEEYKNGLAFVLHANPFQVHFIHQIDKEV